MSLELPGDQLPQPESAILTAMDDFHGVKVALLHEGKILIYLRDDKPGLRYSGLWDLPGGGREGNESPLETVIREVQEEFGIELAAEQLPYTRSYPGLDDLSADAWFMAGHITQPQIDSIRFGSEGQEYKMITFQEYLSLEDAVRPLQERFEAFLASGVSVNP